jgi:hypothetical protein
VLYMAFDGKLHVPLSQEHQAVVGVPTNKTNQQNGQSNGFTNNDTV